MSQVPAFRCDRCGKVIVDEKPKRVAVLDKEYCAECYDRFEAFLRGMDNLTDIAAVTDRLLCDAAEVTTNAVTS